MKVLNVITFLTLVASLNGFAVELGSKDAPAASAALASASPQQIWAEKRCGGSKWQSKDKKGFAKCVDLNLANYKDTQSSSETFCGGKKAAATDQLKFESCVNDEFAKRLMDQSKNQTSCCRADDKTCC